MARALPSTTRTPNALAVADRRFRFELIVASETCSFCRTPLLSNKGFVFCPQCRAPHFYGNDASAFDIFGIPHSIKVDEKALEDRYYELSKQLHPDRFAAGGNAAKFKSQELSAVLNQAYLALKQVEPRLETLLREAGALKENERSANQSQIPAELAEEYFELQEAAMEDPDKAVGIARELRSRLEAQRQELTIQMLAVAEKTNWPIAASGDIEKIVDLRRRRSYIRSMLENIDRLGEKFGVNPG